MLNSIKTLKRYCKVTFEVFKKNFLMMTKKIYFNDRIIVSNQNFFAEHIKNV